MASACHRVRSTCHRHKNRAASRGKTDAEMDEGERAGLAERLRHLKPVEPWHLYDSLNSDEAHEFVSFVLSVVALEAELNRVVAKHSDRSADDVDGATLGRLIGWASRSCCSTASTRRSSTTYGS